jgi:thioredoxin 1
MADLVITDQNFEDTVLKSDLPVLVDFWAQWCPPCKIIAPIIEELANEYAGKIKVGKMDVDANPEVPGKYGIMSIPTLIIFRNGQPVKTSIGAQGKEALKRMIDEALAS